MCATSCLEMFKDWTVLNFPLGEVQAPEACVYVWCLGEDAVPFYVGESGREKKRFLDDYRIKKRNGEALRKFKMPTDFCVAEAIDYLAHIKNQPITLKLKKSSEDKFERKNEEKKLKRSLFLAGCCCLLNFLPRYNPETTTEQEERAIVKSFCEMLCLKV
jgi:hypothetical protein